MALGSGGGFATGGTAGAAGTSGGTAGVSGNTSGGTAGSGAASAGGVGGGAAGAGGAGAGSGGVAGAGGSGATGGAPCDLVGTNCTEDKGCCTGYCGPGVAPDPRDCNAYYKCAECRKDGDCISGRCDDCRCQATVGNGAACDEDEDCVSGSCGLHAGDDLLDCNQYYKCAECRADTDCATGRCEDCGCQAKLGDGASCNENSDCLTNACGPTLGDDYNDCNTYYKCAACTKDAQCSSGRCDDCACAPKLNNQQPCNEDSDCKSGQCTGGKC